MTQTPESVFVDGTAYANPFVAIEKLGEEWAAAGMDPDDIVEAAIAVAGEPRGCNSNPHANLHSYAAETCLLRYRAIDIDPTTARHNRINELEGEA